MASAYFLLAGCVRLGVSHSDPGAGGFISLSSTRIHQKINQMMKKWAAAARAEHLSEQGWQLDQMIKKSQTPAAFSST
ncbi:MAG: hypothetical protein KBT84_12000 [Pseudomonas sp.]|nr:hypothetical protein [Pseudomonas sp.]|tara:strand:+ start:238 stop:471 length:234 start_codon:yes stop_codon:yes gene_type:complete